MDHASLIVLLAVSRLSQKCNKCFCWFIASVLLMAFLLLQLMQQAAAANNMGGSFNMGNLGSKYLLQFFIIVFKSDDQF